MKSSLGGELRAVSEMIYHMSLLPEFHEPFADLSPGAIGFEGCGSLLSHVVHGRTIAAKHLVRRLLGIQRSWGNKELDKTA